MPHCASSFKAIKIYLRIYCVCSHHVTCTALFLAPQPRLTIGFSDAPSLASSRVRTPSPFRSKLQNTLWTFQQLSHSSGWLHGRMACVSYQFRFCWVDASLMFTDWTPFGSWLCGNNGALSILNFSVISTWVDRHVSQVQTGQNKSIGSCLFCTILPPAWCMSLLILSVVPSPLSFLPDSSASCRLRLSSCRATAATQME